MANNTEITNQNAEPNNGKKNIGEVLFTNKYLATEELLRIYNNKIVAKRFRKQFIVFAAVFALLTIPGFVTGDYIIVAVTATCCLIAVILNFSMPKYLLRQTLKAQLMLHKGKVPKTSVQFGETVYLKEGFCEINLEYSQIMEIYFYSEIYVLMFAKDNGIMLKSDGFTQGTAADFKKWIREKCPVARIIDKEK